MITIAITATGYSTSRLAIIAGQVKQLGVPVKSTVKIMMQHSGGVIKTVNTDQNGRYKAYVPYSSAYLVFAQDPQGVFNAVIQDNVVPK